MKLFTFLIVAVLAIGTLVWYRGKNANNSDVVSGRVEGVENLFTPGESSDDAKELPEVAPRGEVKVNPGKVRVRGNANVRTSAIVPESQPYGDEAEKEKVSRSLRESVGAKSVRRSFNANRAVIATRPEEEKTRGGFFFDDDPEKLPKEIKEWEKNKGKSKPGELKFLGRSPNVGEKSVPAAKTGTAELKFLGRSEN